jgi:hypothetical protein
MARERSDTVPLDSGKASARARFRIAQRTLECRRIASGGGGKVEVDRSALEVEVEVDRFALEVEVETDRFALEFELDLELDLELELDPRTRPSPLTR